MRETAIHAHSLKGHPIHKSVRSSVVVLTDAVWIWLAISTQQ